jgi:hypothetical protein
MSISKIMTSYPNTLRGWNVNRNDLSRIAGLFFVLPGVVIPSVSELRDFWYWINTLLKSGSIIPLHNIKKFDPQDEELLTGVSLHNFTYEIDKGKYKHAVTFHVSEAFNQILQSYSGSNLGVIYYDGNRNIKVTRGDGVTFEAFKTDSIITQKLNFASVGNAALTVMKIELEDHEEWNLRGHTERVTWQPELIDRIFIELVVNCFTTSITFSAYLNGVPILDLENSDITITDDSVGNITFSLLNIADGIYTISGLSNTPTVITLSVLSNIYLGRERAIAQSDTIALSYLFEDGNEYLFEDGRLYEFN